MIYVLMSLLLPQEDYLAKERKLTDQVTELRDTQSRVQQKLEMKEKEQSDKQRELVDISRQLKKIGSSGAVIDQIELELRKDVREQDCYPTRSLSQPCGDIQCMCMGDCCIYYSHSLLSTNLYK